MFSALTYIEQVFVLDFSLKRGRRLHTLRIKKSILWLACTPGVFRQRRKCF